MSSLHGEKKMATQSVQAESQLDEVYRMNKIQAVQENRAFSQTFPLSDPIPEHPGVGFSHIIFPNKISKSCTAMT